MTCHSHDPDSLSLHGSSAEVVAMPTSKHKGAELQTSVPVVPFGMDLYHWEGPADPHILPVR